MAGGSNERRPLLVLVVAWLLTDKHDRRLGRSGAEYGLCRRKVEVAALAAGSRRAKRRDRALQGQKLGRGAWWTLCFCCHARRLGPFMFTSSQPSVRARSGDL